MTHEDDVTYRFEATAVGSPTLEIVASKEYNPFFNPLQSNYFEVWRRQYDKGQHDFGCDCGRPEAALHSELCGVTPIYVSVCRDLGQWRHMTLPFVEAMMSVRSMPRSLVRTEEECGRCDGSCPDWLCPLDDDIDY
jgi:hypothetical protein